MPGPKSVEELERQSAIEHYTALRSTIIRCVIFFLVMLVGTLVFVHQLIPQLIVDGRLVMLGPMDVLGIYFIVALSISAGLSIPYVTFEVWRFVKPALTEREAKLTLGYIPAVFGCFIVGLAFGYYVVFPVAYQFLMAVGGIHFDMMITAREYFHFLLMSTLPLGFIFELPLVIMFLTSLGLLTPDTLRKSRRYAYFGLIVISVVITPPDFISDLLLILPLVGLYEVGVWLSKRTYTRMEKETAQQAAS
ncbi:twin-arginine translocase subunit TatC [Bacillus daqingensis]|uniref:Sec-independent protein translocase protein TatC n=1 Tax=Bacillus daqingensis TaxID=872396 RepID=A0ABV9NZX3_9BACI